jgi:predicted ABC-type ATPase
VNSPASEGRLSPGEHERVYAEIRDRYLPKSQPQDQPVAIITGGQPGSGKSRITSEAMAELAARGGYVLVDADKLRRFHPGFDDLMREDDRTAANLTHPDCGAWASSLRHEGMASGRNLIIDQTTRDPESLERISGQLRDSGYRIELRVMAVNEAVSEQRIYTRYEHQKDEMGIGRFSTKDKHDEAYAGVPKALAAAEDKRLVDVIRIQDKDHNRIYENQLKGPGEDWQRPHGAASALADERARPLTLAEKRELASNYAELGRMVNAPGRNAMPEEKGAIEQKQIAADNAAAAEMFRQRPQAEVVAAHPKTAAAYAFVEAARKASQALPSDEHRRAVEQQIRTQVASAMEKGAYPRVAVRDTYVEQDQGKGQER